MLIKYWEIASQNVRNLKTKTENLVCIYKKFFLIKYLWEEIDAENMKEILTTFKIYSKNWVQ